MNGTEHIDELENKISEPDEKELSELEHRLFLCSLKTANDFYLYTVIISGAIAAAGLIYAVLSSVFFGLVIAILGVLIYTASTSNILYKKLGISYRSTSGALTVTQLYGQSRHNVWIPERLLWLSVTEIGDRAFDHASSASIQTVYLPATVKVIGEDIFKGCTQLETICFEGTREQWAQVESSTDFSGYQLIFANEADQKEVQSDADATEDNKE